MVQASKQQGQGTGDAASGGAAAWITRLESPLAGSPQGPLAGLRFAAKDNIDAAGVRTTAACEAFAYVPETHAVVVQRLLDAGADLAGKTNLDQFACGLNGTRSPWGPVPNAFDPAYVSGGSSAGSAYVVATGQVDFSLGTDTAGSGRVPAGLNNIVGLKPSKGLISARGVVPAAQSVDVVSIFSGTVAGAARVLQQARGFDADDPFSRKLALPPPRWGEGFRFGVPDVLEFHGDDLSRQAFAAALRGLQALGGTPVTIPYAPLAQAANLLYDSALVAERYAAIRGFFDAHEGEVIEPVRSIIAGGRRFLAADWVDASLRLRQLGRQADRMWQDIDVLVVPTAPTHYRIDAMQANPVVLNRNLGAYTNFVNLLDYGALSVPASMRSDGLPFGITLIAPAGMDWSLTDLGQRFHLASGLTQGATGRPLGEALDMDSLADREPSLPVAVVGAHLSGMPLNGQLRERGARLLRTTRTAPDYRLVALPATQPPKPGLIRCEAGTGTSIEVEIWDMPLTHYGSFVSLVAAPLSIGWLRLEDGSQVQGFLCEHWATRDAQDISSHGGWRAYLKTLGR